MTSKNKNSTIASPSSVEFEPYCEWKKEENVDTLVFHLPDFKKDQLRVQVNNLGLLKVSGDRLLTETGNGTKRKTFLKETKIPQGCDINDIRAKFTGGCLHVIMPKKPIPQLQDPETKPSGAPHSEPVDSSKRKGSESSYDPTKEDKMFGRHGSSSLGRLQVQMKVSVSLGVAVAVMVAIGAYAAYKYGSSTAPLVED